MKISLQIKGLLVKTICYLYIVLFTYAGVSKLLDYPDFSIKLGQSPVLSLFAGTITWAVPATEFIIVLLLVLERTRFYGLFASYCLMVLFTTYIYIILHFSSFVPCSCGGILENMGWSEHLLFNIFFITAAVVALLIFPDFYQKALFKKFLIVLGSGIISALIVIALFLFSEKEVEKNNPFVRRFPEHPQPEIKKMDLSFNSYYFAGLFNGNIYLGNSTAPLYVTVVNTELTSKTRRKITLNRSDFSFRSLQLSVVKERFYLTDGTVPCVFMGKVIDWQANYENRPIPFFSLAKLIDTSGLVLRSTSLTHHSNTLRTHNFSLRLSDRSPQLLLPTQVDGIFDTDGMLLYNDLQNSIHYVYYYRNQYLTTDLQLHLLRNGRTIDTTTRAVIKIMSTSNGAKTMVDPPVLINKGAAVYGNLLFVHSDRLGKYEGKKILRHAAIIDVYDHNKGTYISSFYVYNVGEASMFHFLVDKNNLYTLTGTFLTLVPLPQNVINALNK